MAATKVARRVGRLAALRVVKMAEKMVELRAALKAEMRES